MFIVLVHYFEYLVILLIFDAFCMMEDTPLDLSIGVTQPVDIDTGPLNLCLADLAVAEPPDSDPKKYSCVKCGKEFNNKSNMLRHLEAHGPVLLQCPHCSKKYSTRGSLAMHIRTHYQSFECPYCAKSFSRQWLLKSHIRTHTGEKPFACQLCSKPFADKSNLRSHMKTHSKHKPFRCTQCGRGFARKSYLLKHIRRRIGTYQHITTESR